MSIFPIGVINIYIFGTMLLSFLLPIKYADYDIELTCLYIVCFLICLNTGYYLSGKCTLVFKRNDFSISESQGSKKGIIKFVEACIVISLVATLIQFGEAVASNPAALLSLNFGANYVGINRNVESSISAYSLGIILRFATSFPRNVALILGMFYWKEIKTTFRYGFAMLIILLIISNVIMAGTQKFLGDIFIYFSLIGYVKSLNYSSYKRHRFIVYASIMLVTIVIFFSFVQIQRYESIGIDLSNISLKSGSEFDLDSMFFIIFGNVWGFGLVSILSYITQGYYGLSLCLQLPFEWTYGLGSSYAVSVFVNKWLNITDVYSFTYLNRMFLEFNRNGLRNWNTIFPWLASDFTFVGALLLFVPIGYLFGKTWQETIKYKNPVSLVLFVTIFLGMIFVPANNQLFHGVDSFISTVSIIVFWVVEHNNYNQRYKNAK